MSSWKWSALYLVAAVAILLAVACSPSDTSSEDSQEAPMEDIRTVPSNCVDTVDEHLRIGAGNFWKDEYVDDEGRAQRGVTCMLALWTLDDSSPYQTCQVHPGQEIAYDRYAIRVVEIGGDREGLFVRLAVEAGEEPEP